LILPWGIQMIPISRQLRSHLKKRVTSCPPFFFWNLRGKNGSRSCPVKKDERGTLLLSGYSGKLLAYIMGAKEIEKMNPLDLMMKAISNESYQKFAVFD